MRHIVYLINPISGTGGKKSLKSLISRLTEEQRIHFSMVDTHPTGDYHFLREKIKLEYVTDVVVVAGDGTVRQVAKALQGIPVPVSLGIIPRGSGNGLAFAAGIPKDPRKALEIIFANRYAPVDAFYVNEQFCCMLSGLGFDAQVAHDFARSGTRGLPTYIKISFRNFFAAKTYPFEVYINGQQFNTDAYFISIANSNQFGNHFTIAPEASLKDGMLDIVIVQQMSKWKLVGSILRQVRNGKAQRHYGLKDSEKDILYFQAKSLTIRNPRLAPLHIDGDPWPGNDTFTIQVIPKAIRLLQPLAPLG
jgi:diacylglycerol kinase (ATP)